MDALEIIQEVSEDGYIHIKIPKEMGRKVKTIILPIVPAKRNEKDDYIKLQIESEFMKNVILSEEEDRWNDVL